MLQAFLSYAQKEGNTVNESLKAELELILKKNQEDRIMADSIEKKIRLTIKRTAHAVREHVVKRQSQSTAYSSDN